MSQDDLFKRIYTWPSPQEAKCSKPPSPYQRPILPCKIALNLRGPGQQLSLEPKVINTILVSFILRCSITFILHVLVVDPNSKFSPQKSSKTKSRGGNLIQKLFVLLTVTNILVKVMQVTIILGVQITFISVHPPKTL
jgi:hypothetical protein